MIRPFEPHDLVAGDDDGSARWMVALEASGSEMQTASRLKEIYLLLGPVGLGRAMFLARNPPRQCVLTPSTSISSSLCTRQRVQHLDELLSDTAVQQQQQHHNLHPQAVEAHVSWLPDRLMLFIPASQSRGPAVDPLKRPASARHPNF